MLRGLFRTRNLDDILKNIDGPQFGLKRTLGAFNVAKTAPPDNNAGNGEGVA
ncbi:MAG: hypothetical protein M3447_11890 [Acidobacteriota bacterium]|nr:hypothetical protein [Acidobacteriota bacterium]